MWGSASALRRFLPAVRGVRSLWPVRVPLRLRSKLHRSSPVPFPTVAPAAAVPRGSRGACVRGSCRCRQEICQPPESNLAPFTLTPICRHVQDRLHQIMEFPGISDDRSQVASGKPVEEVWTSRGRVFANSGARPGDVDPACSGDGNAARSWYRQTRSRSGSASGLLLPEPVIASRARRCGTRCSSEPGQGSPTPLARLPSRDAGSSGIAAGEGR